MRTQEGDSMADARAQALAERFEQAHNEVIATVEGLSDAQWSAPGADEGRTVGITAHHIAASYPSTFGLVQTVASGQELPAVGWDMIHAMNARHAEQHAGVGKAETLKL